MRAVPFLQMNQDGRTLTLHETNESSMAEASGERVRRHRKKLRAAGLRPVQIWVPDTRRRGFAEECRRQCRLLRDDGHEARTLNWLEAVADSDGWK